MRAVGIDGGGTHTRFVFYDEKAGIVKSSEIDKPSNYHLVGIEAVEKVFKEGISDVTSGEPFEAMGVGLSGIDRPRDHATISKIFEDLGIENPSLANDGVTALWGATGGVGIMLISGTGSIVIGRNEKGRIRRAGGWGYMLDEFCGGFWFSNRAAVAALNSKDGTGPETTLTEKLKEHFGLDGIEDVIYLYYSNFDKSKIASGSKLVFEEAEKGDIVSLTIVRDGIESALKMIQTVAKGCEFGEEFTFSYTGGLFRSEYFLRRMRRAFEAEFPKAEFVSPKFSAEIGAALMAIDDRRSKDEKTFEDLR